jgi:hypothetical protein
MKTKAGYRLVKAAMQERLERFGFRRVAQVEFGRPDGDGLSKLSFPARQATPDEVRVTCHVSVHFAQVADLVSADVEVFRPWVCSPIHLLRPNKAISEWSLHSEGGVPGVADAMVLEIEQFALPYIDRYSRLDAIREALASERREDWIDLGLDPVSRVCWRSALEWIRGDPDRAVSILERALIERANERPGRNYNIEYLLKRFRWLRGTAGSS